MEHSAERDSVQQKSTGEYGATEKLVWLTALVESSNDAFINTKLGGLIVDWNPAAERIYGYSSEEMIGRSIFAIIPAESRGEVDEIIKKVMNGKPAQMSDTVRRRKDGTIIPVSVTFSPIFSRQGRLIGISSITHDNTKQKEIEERLQNSLKDFRTLIEQASDGIFIANIEGQFTEVNDAGLNLFGYSRGEILRKTIADLLSDDEIPRFHKTKEALLQTGNSELSEWNGKRKDGTILPVEVSAKMLPGGRWLAFLRDITKRREVERKNAFFIESSRIISETVDYHERLRKISNLLIPEFADVCLVFTQQHQRLSLMAIAHIDPDKLPLFEETFKKYPIPTNPSGHGYSVSNEQAILRDITDEYLHQISEGEEHFKLLKKLNYRSYISIPLFAREKLIGVISMGMSDSGRHYTNDDLEFAKIIASRFAYPLDNSRLYSEAVQATQLRESVLAVVSHDLKNPLSATKLACQNFSKIIENREPLDIRKYIGMILRNTDRALNIIQDLLNVSQLQIGTFSLHPVLTSLSDIVLDTAASLQPLAENKSIALRVDVQKDIANIFCDPDRIYQVISNIIGNAIKFSPQKGQILVEVKPITNAFKVSVTDSGPGIPSDQLPHVFEKFWQAQRGNPGSIGLGLAIAKGIIDAHGGHIWAESEPGNGASFHFTIPTNA